MMKRKEYAWILIIACGLAASAIGLCSNSVGVFYTTVSQDLGVLRGTFAFHATLSLMATAAVSLLVPWLSRRFSYRPLMLTGILVSALSTMVMGQADHIAAFYILGIIRGAGTGLYGTVPITMLVNGWFHKKNGTAVGIALSFSGLSGAVCSPLLSQIITGSGWKTAYMVMGILILAFALPAFLFPFAMTPGQMGLRAYGDQEGASSGNRTTAKGSVTNPSFSYACPCFVMMCVFTLLHTSITGITQHFSGYTKALRLGETFGAAMMSFSMMGNICTKLIIGFLSDRLKPVKACLIMMAVNLCSILALMTGTGSAQLLAASFFFGSVYSVGAVGIPLLTRYFFGNDHYAKAYSVIGFFTSLGSSCSLPVIGYLYDLSGSYQYAFAGAACFHLVNGILLGLIALSRKPGKISSQKNSFPVRRLLGSQEPACGPQMSQVSGKCCDARRF